MVAAPAAMFVARHGFPRSSKGIAMHCLAKFLTGTVAALALGAGMAMPAKAQDAAKLNDLEIAHVAYTASLVDIRYAHLALALSSNGEVRNFAETMIRDHTAVNDKALALLKKLNLAPQDNGVSQSLVKGAGMAVDDMRKLDGKAFDAKYVANELAYHQAVNGLLGSTFIPNAKNAELKALLEVAQPIFKEHETHVSGLVAAMK
jgi:putative membrane protein